MGTIGKIVVGSCIVALSAMPLFGQSKQAVKEPLNKPPLVQTLKDKPLAEPPVLAGKEAQGGKSASAQAQSSMFSTHSVFAIGWNDKKTEVKNETELEKAKTSPGVKAIEYRDNSTGAFIVLPPASVYFPSRKAANQPAAPNSVQNIEPITDVEYMTTRIHPNVRVRDVDTSKGIYTFRFVSVTFRNPELGQPFSNGRFGLSGPHRWVGICNSNWSLPSGKTNLLGNDLASMLAGMLGSYMKIEHSNGTPNMTRGVINRIDSLGYALTKVHPEFAVVNTNSTDSGVFDHFVIAMQGYTTAPDSAGGYSVLTRSSMMLLVPKHIAQAGYVDMGPMGNFPIVLGSGILAGKYARSDTSWTEEHLGLYLGTYQAEIDTIAPSTFRLTQTQTPFTVKFITPPTGVEGPEAVPATFSLGQNYPNPFNPSTRVRFEVPKSAHVSIRVYDLLGREVAVLADGSMPPGTYEATFSASGLPSGIYFYKMTADAFSETKKMVLLK